ncbi:restriction endonuclease subunit S [Staphylococcus aureus]|uniref:restriction endonuclease subunit S n=2 Tax=Staphylococcus aureus TaxID=1280 RepID=UPI0013C6ECC2|nr:restriction endonuclease subunit S [Staphylococcus aureus]NEF38712.1 restriction endonuclease subunit S [Staphylococcus aureus]NGC01746.1 restriction endonuclease subunit S [Staphylococcus aureus]
MSNTQKKNVPELRFPGFEGEWEEKKLGEVAEIYDGTHQTPKYTNEGIKFLSVENIKTLNSSKYISEEAFEKEFKIRPEFGDILMTRIGDIGTPNIVSSNEKFAYYVSLALLKTKNLNSYFLKNLILSSSIQNELWRKTLHVAFPKKINKNEIGKIKINFPTNKEQQKIGKFFSKLDRQIELEEQKLELLQQQKKGYMQKIFSQELRFKDENGNDYPDWEEKKIEDIASQVYGGGTPNTKIKEFWNGDIPWIQSSDVKVNDLILQQCNKFISKNSIELSSAKLIPANSIAIVTRVGVGKLCLVEFDYATSQDFLSLSSLKYDKLYSLYSLLYTMKKISANLQGTSIKGITKKELLDSIIKIPHNLEEQQKIGELFYKIDKYISFNKCKIEMLKSLKQGLLQKMFI